MTVIASILGVVLTAALGLIVYQYRALVTYKTNNIDLNLDIENNELVLSDQGLSISVCTLEIINRGFINIDNFEFHSDIIYDLIGSQVDKTTTVAKGAISIEQNGKALVIACKSLPRRETLNINLMFRGRNMLWDARGNGPKYTIKPTAYFEGIVLVLKFTKRLIFGAAVGALIVIAIKNAVWQF